MQPRAIQTNRNMRHGHVNIDKFICGSSVQVGGFQGNNLVPFFPQHIQSMGSNVINRFSLRSVMSLCRAAQKLDLQQPLRSGNESPLPRPRLL